MVLGPDGFFDGCLFDPDEIETYIHSFDTKTRMDRGTELE
jgi:hypothetical protein